MNSQRDPNRIRTGSACRLRGRIQRTNERTDETDRTLTAAYLAKAVDAHARIGDQSQPGRISRARKLAGNPELTNNPAKALMPKPDDETGDAA